MDLNQLNELDFNNIGDWPGPVKAVAIALLCGALAGGWYYYDTKDQVSQLQTTEQKEPKLRASFEAKQRKAANLNAYRHQLEEMKESFGAMLRQLPDKTEVAALLHGKKAAKGVAERLTMSATVKTYRYLDEPGGGAPKHKRGKKKGGRR
ncbi:MAG: type 4a pilus biogenesis protein PilO [Chromatiaceae bacterium]